MINFAPFISFMLNKKKADQPRQITESEKKEIDKVNNMEFFDAIDYLKKK